MFKCDLCGDTFRKEIKLRYHRISYCCECELEWEWEKEADIHIDQKHKFKCNICEVKFVKESKLKYHIQVWYCDKCDLTYECEYKFIDHIEDHYESNLEPTVKANDDKHEREVDEASTDEEHTDDVTLFEKTLIPTRPKDIIDIMFSFVLVL